MKTNFVFPTENNKPILINNNKDLLLKRRKTYQQNKNTFLI